jgi:hypothetical protein
LLAKDGEQEMLRREEVVAERPRFVLCNQSRMAGRGQQLPLALTLVGGVPVSRQGDDKLSIGGFLIMVDRASVCEMSVLPL